MPPRRAAPYRGRSAPQVLENTLRLNLQLQQRLARSTKDLAAARDLEAHFHRLQDPHRASPARPIGQPGNPWDES